MNVREFRQDFWKHNNIRYSGIAHIVFVNVAAWSTIIYCIATLENATLKQWLTLPIVFLYGNLVEYFGHRFPMHNPTRFLKILYKRHTIQHHHYFVEGEMYFDSPRDLKMVLFPASLIVFFIGGFAIPQGLLLYYLFGANIGKIFVVSAMLYYLTYEWLHFFYHLPPTIFDKVPFLAYVKRHHQRHHNQKIMSHYNFNLTFPLMDFILGTTYKENLQGQSISKAEGQA